MFGAAKRDRAFKDYCLILQVHPEADAAMVDAAYWHLAKRYNEASAYDPQAKAKLEELNEAYIVLGSAEKREEYMKVRAEVLGEGALPQAPRPAPKKPPLAVMSRQLPQERDRVTEEVAGERLRVLTVRNAATVFVLAGLVGVALAATVSLVMAVAVAGVIAAAIVAVTGVVAGLPRLRGARRAPGSPSARHFASSSDGTDGDPLGKIKSQTEQVRRISTKPEAPQDEGGPAPDVSANASKEPDLQQSHTSDAPVNALAVLASDLSDVAQPDEHKESSGQWSTAGEAQPMDDAQVEKLKQQTERLRNIAAKFNAAKLEPRPDPTPKD